jgi:mRNA (guanine-N7-)-methyltransferase
MASIDVLLGPNKSDSPSDSSSSGSSSSDEDDVEEILLEEVVLEEGLVVRATSNATTVQSSSSSSSLALASASQHITTSAPSISASRRKSTSPSSSHQLSLDDLITSSQDPPSKTLKYDPTAPESTLVSAHYNQRRDEGMAKRKQSAIIELRNFNNWIKSILIAEYVKPGDGVLDMACGKGGDLIKYSKARVGYYVGMDIAHVSVTHAVDRYNKNAPSGFPAMFCSGDCFSPDHDIDQILDPSLRFDVVSCQFAFHYAFASEEKVRAALHNISCRLKDNGVFISTTTNANVIVKKLRMQSALQISNGICTIEFDSLPDGSQAFGLRYLFTLLDAVDRVPEYLVHIPSLQRLAAEYGLSLELNESFHSFFNRFRNHPQHASMISKQLRHAFPANQWDVAYLYSVLVLRKVPSGRSSQPMASGVPAVITSRLGPGMRFDPKNIQSWCTARDLMEHANDNQAD